MRMRTVQATMSVWKKGSIEVRKNSRIMEGWKSAKDGNPRRTEGWNGPSRPP